MVIIFRRDENGLVTFGLRMAGILYQIYQYLLQPLEIPRNGWNGFVEIHNKAVCALFNHACRQNLGRLYDLVDIDGLSNLVGFVAGKRFHLLHQPVPSCFMARIIRDNQRKLFNKNHLLFEFSCIIDMAWQIVLSYFNTKY